MHRSYRSALAALALLAMSTAAPPASAAQEGDARPRALRPGSTAPLTLADFSGGWWHHGFGFGIQPDGSGEGSWRVYRWCKDTAGRSRATVWTGTTSSTAARGLFASAASMGAPCTDRSDDNRRRHAGSRAVHAHRV